MGAVLPASTALLRAAFQCYAQSVFLAETNCHLKLSFLDRHYASQIARTRPQVTRAPSGFRKFQAQHLMLSRESGQPGAAATQTGEILKTNRDKLALRRQSIRMLTNSELRSAHGGGTTAAPASGTDDRGWGTSVIHASSGTSVINPSGGSALNPSGGRVLNLSGDRLLSPSAD
jgi:hypothetical protein